MLRKVPAGFDEFVTEKYQDQIAAVFREWSSQLLAATKSTAALEKVIPAHFSASSLKASKWRPVYAETSLSLIHI